MTKTILIILSSSFLLGLSAFSVHQYDPFNNRDIVISQKNQEIKQLANAIEVEKNEKQVLKVRNNVLMLEIERLKDSISSLQNEVLALRLKVDHQQKLIQQIQSKLKVIMMDYAGLKNKISELSRQEVIDQKQILQLEKEKAILRDKIEQLNLQEEQKRLEQQQTEEAIQLRRAREGRYLELANIVKNTQIKYQKISIRKKKFGKPLTKILKGQKNWRYTVIEFYMDNADIQSILDKNFKIKIVDVDSYEVMSYIEMNPTFPDSKSDTKSVDFTFDGNLIELAHQNNQQKMGKNYELQVYYVAEDSKEYLLANGTRPFIQNRKAIGL